jgi:hypothetical protein
MLQEVLTIDLMREIGAMVLDKHPDSASVANALLALRDKELLAELEAEYRVVRPLAKMDEDLTPELRAAIDEDWKASELQEQLSRFKRLRTELKQMGAELANSDVGKLLWKARSKSVAHYDVARVGNDFKMWRVEGLTWGQVNAFVDMSTRAIDLLSQFVRQTGFDFEGFRPIAQKCVDEYVSALTAGMQLQKQAQAERRAKLIEGEPDDTRTA